LHHGYFYSVAKEILLYSPIYSFTAEQYIAQMEANKDVDISVRMNCPGGDVLACYGMIAKFGEHPKGKKIQVDGQAKSCGFYMCLNADEVECLDKSEFLAHRAAYGSWIEKNPELFTDAAKAELNKTNSALREMIEGKVTAQKFKTVTGVSLDDMFSLDSRIDVPITAEMMKKMGLVTKVTKLTKEKKAQIMALSAECGVAAFAHEPEIETEVTNDTKIKAMTAAEFKAAHPAEYDKIVAEGKQAEKSRVSSLMKFSAIDPKAVAEAIAGDKPADQEFFADMTAKAIAGGLVGKAKSENAEDVTTTAVSTEVKTAAQITADANAAEFLKNCKAQLGIPEPSAPVKK
jgi:ATP-dependent protease ClpP protease subunit